MAHTITGIDVGAHSVKFALIETGFRHMRFLGTYEEPVAAGATPLADRQRQALLAGLARVPSERTIHVAMPGDQLAVRVLELPFADARKVDQVVGYELEGQIVHPLEEVVYDHVILEVPGETTSVLAVAAKIEDVAALLDGLKETGADPRALFAAPVMYRSLPNIDRLPDSIVPDALVVELPDELTGEAAPATLPSTATVATADAASAERPPCRMVIDFGHARTNLCVLEGRQVLFARTVLRGGEGLTAAIAQALQTDVATAERAKRERGIVASARVQPDDALGERLSDSLHMALAPWLRELRQSVASFRSQARRPVGAFTLVGGSARLRGLVELLEDDLGIPHAALADEGEGASLEPAPDPRFALVSAIAWAGARGSREIDLRRGPFLYKANFSLLRQKAWHLGGLAAALAVALMFDGVMTLGRLSREHDQLEASLRAATQDLFGQARMDARQVTAELRKSFKDEMVQLPKMTAFDLLDQISAKTPPPDKLKLDVTELDIRPKKSLLKGTADSVAAIDEMIGKLKEIDCFEEITKGAITEVSGGAKQFTLTINSKCP